MASTSRIACLGPLGTHSELALREYLPSAEVVLCPSIAAVFEGILKGSIDAKPIDGGFVPIENMIQGPVTETLDLLLLNKHKIMITDSFLASIRNAVGVLQDNLPWPREIKRVYSHNQALQQCSKTLLSQFPGLELIPTPSTALGIQYVRDGKQTDAAVVGTAASLKEAGFRILLPDASDVTENKTRFVFLKRGEAEKLLSKRELAQKGKDTPTYVTSLVVNPVRDRQGLLFEILQVISVKHQVNLVTIHSRPDTKGGVVFHLDLEGHPDDPQIKRCLEDLNQFSIDSTGTTVEIVILGAYPLRPFYTPPFRSVGIVGSEGRMGKWFTRFFQDAGLTVYGSDKTSGETLQALAKKSDVIILSVPMSAAAAVLDELLPHLRAGQLVVENCSIKSCILPTLSASAPKGVETLGLHTMFGGDIPSLHGQNVVVTRTPSSGEMSTALENLLYKWGAVMSHSSVEAHDEVSSFVQSVVQLAMVILADVMSKSFHSLEELQFISSPNFRNTLQVMTRVVSQSDDLILDLQTINIRSERMRHRFLESAVQLVSALDQNDMAAVKRAVNQARVFLKASEDAEER